MIHWFQCFLLHLHLMRFGIPDTCVHSQVAKYYILYPLTVYFIQSAVYDYYD